MKEQTNGEKFEEFMNSVQYPELEGTNALCEDVIKKKTGKMTEEEWQAAERGEISDEEIKENIEKALNKFKQDHTVLNLYPSNMLQNIAEFVAKWYREQLKSRQ